MSDAVAEEQAVLRELSVRQFPCRECGAHMVFSAKRDALVCQYCDAEQAVEMGSNRIVEQDFHATLEALEQKIHPHHPRQERIDCQRCGASFSLEQSEHAGDCPFCGNAVVSGTTEQQSLPAQGLLPFSITQAEAKQAYAKWLKELWFAPNKLKQYARSDTSLHGVYLPYWTFDSQSSTRYRGERGDIYYVRQRVTVVENGKRVVREQAVPKVRWRAASGRVSRHFDDVLVGASSSLPRTIIDWLEPWDLQALEPYSEGYLSGFSSQVYEVDLDEGFEIARKRMAAVIHRDVRSDIGGDRQRIHQLNTQHDPVTFKHILLPIWSAAFTFGDKQYRFVVNGRTGKVQGERPYSIWKILAAATAAIALAGGVFMASESMDASGFRLQPTSTTTW